MCIIGKCHFLNEYKPNGHTQCKIITNFELTNNCSIQFLKYSFYLQRVSIIENYYSSTFD